ncbi:hypothetical protein ECANGB1_270 [Enterospora canceri]|uniref:Uncharacterized protein n=1 Tax=Enterospora canceri TaxID=1081671 RepID=A0A1Y1S582_9MICR|nr:hypothetical protein ECANGB1_270 [Enterospora canceri]
MAMVVIVGDTPAAAVCAIYLKTANIETVLLRSKSGYEYTCTAVACVDDLDNFTSNTFKQVEYLGVPVMEETVASITKKDDHFLIKTGETEHVATVVVSETDLFGLSGTANYHVILGGEKKSEAILLAAEGCKTAFRIKESL